MKLTVLGGAGEHGRACFLLEERGLKILLDCGEKEGTKVERYPALTREIAQQLDAVFLSHIHADHYAGLPWLFKYGYPQNILASQFSNHYLPELLQLPLGGKELANFEAHGPAGSWFRALPNLNLCWGRSGHAPGAVWLLLQSPAKTVLYTGDYTPNPPLLRHDSLLENELLLSQQIDLAIMDCAYTTQSDTWETAFAELKKTLATVLGRNGTVLLPVPRFGRGQELLLLLQKAFPDVELLIESEIYHGLQVYLEHDELLSTENKDRISKALSAGLRIVANDRERENAIRGRQIIITPDSRLESAAAHFYLQRLGGEPLNALIITGHIDNACLQRTLSQTSGKRFNMQILHQCYKIHQGISDIRNLLKRLKPEHTLLVHADKRATDLVVNQLVSEGFKHVHSLTANDTLSF